VWKLRRAAGGLYPRSLGRKGDRYRACSLHAWLDDEDVSVLEGLPVEVWMGFEESAAGFCDASVSVRRDRTSWRRPAASTSEEIRIRTRDPGTAATVIAGTTDLPGTAWIRTPIARPNANKSSASVGALSGEEGRETRGSEEPLACPKRR
jgi:hypothetical protein